jgi:hypothetical protein
MDWSTSKLIRIESGDVAISKNDLRALLRHYEVTEADKVEQLEEAARASKERGTWWTGYREATAAQYLKFLAYENAASAIHQFEPLVIPGLLQDEDYARAILRAVAGSASDTRVEDWVELRMRRQLEVFDREVPPEMLFVLDEAAVRRWVGGAGVMRRRLHRLRGIAGGSQKNVSVEIVPFEAGAHPGMKGPLVVLEFADEEADDVLFLENSRGDMVSRDDQDELLRARQSLNQLRRLAREADPVALIDHVLEEMS